MLKKISNSNLRKTSIYNKKAWRKIKIKANTGVWKKVMEKFPKNEISTVERIISCYNVDGHESPYKTEKKIEIDFTIIREPLFGSSVNISYVWLIRGCRGTTNFNFENTLSSFPKKTCPGFLKCIQDQNRSGQRFRIVSRRYAQVGTMCILRRDVSPSEASRCLRERSIGNETFWKTYGIADTLKKRLPTLIEVSTAGFFAVEIKINRIIYYCTTFRNTISTKRKKMSSKRNERCWTLENFHHIYLLHRATLNNNRHLLISIIYFFSIIF